MPSCPRDAHRNMQWLCTSKVGLSTAPRFLHADPECLTLQSLAAQGHTSCRGSMVQGDAGEHLCQGVKAETTASHVI